MASFKPMTFPAIGGTWTLDETVYRDLCEDFPELDVDACLRDARAWARANPPKKNVHRYITNWIIRNRQNGVHLRIVRTSMPSFTGTDYAIKWKERAWRKQPHLARAEVDDMYQREQERLANERDAGEVTHIGQLLAEGNTP